MKASSEIIRGLREDKDLSQIDLGKLLGTTQQQYSCYETGATELPNRVLLILADYYGVSTDYILGRTQCTQGVDALNKKVDTNHTVGELISDVLALDKAGRAYVLESIALQKAKAKS